MNKELKYKFTLYSQKQTSAKNIFILNIDPSILINKWFMNLIKKIWDYYLFQYKKKILC